MRRIAVTLAALLILATLTGQPAAWLAGAQSNYSSPVVVQHNASGTTGAAPPARAEYQGELSSGNLVGHIGCDNFAVYDAATSGSTQLVALVSGKTIYVCGFVIFSAGTANVKLLYGTGTACATGPVNMTPAFQLIAQTGASYGNGEGIVTKTAASNALCLNSSAAVAVQALVTYTQQ